MATEYKIHCIDCGSAGKNIPVKNEVIFDCEKCGFSFEMDSVVESLQSPKELTLTVVGRENMFEVFSKWKKLEEPYPEIYCPFCGITTICVQKGEGPTYYSCEKCQRHFFLEIKT